MARNEVVENGEERTLRSRSRYWETAYNLIQFNVPLGMALPITTEIGDVVLVETFADPTDVNCSKIRDVGHP